MTSQPHVPAGRRGRLLPASWRRYPASWGYYVVATVGAIATGVLVVVAPAGLIALAAVAAGLLLLRLGRGAVAVFHVALAVILIGYAFLGKGFAYLSVPPLYVGELVLALAVVAILVTLPRARFGVLHVLIAAFMAWGAARTIPYLSSDGLDALRDSVTWSYALFAVAVSITLRPLQLRLAARGYRRLLPVFLGWIPIAAVITLGFGSSIPLVPGSTVPIVTFKAGDTAVHLAAIAAFMLLGLYVRTGRSSGLREVGISAMLLVDAALVAALNRAALVALVSVAAVPLFVRQSGRWLALAFTGAALTVAVVAVDPQVDVGLPRSLSVDQVIDNMTSLFTEEGETVNQATRAWRIQWWTSIVDYTVGGAYFWTGKGFGVNLADDDGFQVLADGSLRAPHSVHMEVLARMGVPGLLLWVVLQAAFAMSLLRAAFRAYRLAPAWVAVLGWVFVYWLAAMLDGSFDVYIGGPVGGIWFWSVIGLGVAAIRLSTTDAACDPVAPSLKDVMCQSDAPR